MKTFLFCIVYFPVFLLSGCAKWSAESDFQDMGADLAEPQEEFARELEGLRNDLDSLQWQYRRAQEQLDYFKDEYIVHRKRLAAYEAIAQRHEGELPKRFTDTLEYPDTEAIEFVMVRVPGDQEKGIEPFYMSATEVSWQMIEHWAYSQDILVDESARLYSLGLRPSPPYQASNPYSWEGKKHPALGMSYQSAQLFCLHLSEKTGRIYRLPTEQEWRYAYRLGGGVPQDPVERQQFVSSYENTIRIDHSDDVFWDPSWEPTAEELAEMSRVDQMHHFACPPVGSHQPDRLGLYDMLGSAAEWVSTGLGNKPEVVGGHYLMLASELSPLWSRREDPEKWNANYPLRPASWSWYYDYPFTGIRLVCESVNIPE